LRDRRDAVELSLHRASLVTMLPGDRGQPKILRRARAHEKIVTRLPLYRRRATSGGDFASKPWSSSGGRAERKMVGEALDAGQFAYRLDQALVPQAKEIGRLLERREVKEAFLTSSVRRRSHLNTMNEQGSLAFSPRRGPTGERLARSNYPKVMKVGLTGISPRSTRNCQDACWTMPLREDNLPPPLRISCEGG